MEPVRHPARYFYPSLLLALSSVNCHKETTSPPVDEGCFGAQCVEQAEAAMYYGDHAAAREPLAAVCEGGDAFACFRLAELHQHGRGGAVDLAKAAELYEKSCATDYGEACERRSQLAAGGLGGPPVELDYSIKGCDELRPLACKAAADQLLAGRGVEPDPVKAATFFERSCKLGEVAGCTGAGDVLSDPAGPNEAKVRALSAYISACVGHSGYGCLKAGVAFHEGIGTKQDLEKAKMHFVRACEWSDQDGCHAAEQLAASGGEPVVLELTTAVAELGRDGLEARSVTCRMSEQGLPALAEVLSSVARGKPALDTCAKEGAAVAVSWEFTKGRVQEAKITDRGSKKLANCVVSALRKAKMPDTGTCEAVLLLGDPDGAMKALAARPAAVKRLPGVRAVAMDDE